jgi:hypothetical protein
MAPRPRVRSGRVVGSARSRARRSPRSTTRPAPGRPGASGDGSRPSGNSSHSRHKKPDGHNTRLTPRSGRFGVRLVRQDQPRHQGPPPSSLAVHLEVGRGDLPPPAHALRRLEALLMIPAESAGSVAAPVTGWVARIAGRPAVRSCWCGCGCEDRGESRRGSCHPPQNAPSRCSTTADWPRGQGWTFLALEAPATRPTAGRSPPRWTAKDHSPTRARRGTRQ